MRQGSPYGETREAQDEARQAQDGPRGTQYEARGTQNDPKKSQERPKMRQERPNMSQERPKMSQERPTLSQERPQRAKKKKSNQKHPQKLTPKSHVFLTFLGSNFGPSSGLCFGAFLGPCCFKNLAFCLGGPSKMLSPTICFREPHVRGKVTKNTPNIL